MKSFIFSLFLVLSFTSVANSDSGFILQKNQESNSIISKNVINPSLYSSGYESCIANCEADYDYYCSGGNEQSWECEYIEDELYACYDYCNYSYP